MLSQAIEDNLQQGVPDTIKALREADMKIWVLTGDKEGTAINIGYSCNLISKKLELFRLSKAKDAASMRDELQAAIDYFGDGSDPKKKGAIVINGTSLVLALLPDLSKLFLKLALLCDSCICCRVSPLQKSEVVSLVRRNIPVVTLAIGDGANDVAMIQEAHIGIGISGMEGTQASNSSDYSIAQFRFLQRLLLVHGRVGYIRLSRFLLYYFYKNVALCMAEFWFAW